MVDSMIIEDAFSANPDISDPVPSDGGRYDVNIRERTKTAVYWAEEETMPIRRCSWFYKSNSGKSANCSSMESF